MSPRPFRNVKVNVVEPTTVTDRTAVVLLATLNADPTNEVFACDVHAAVQAAVGTTREIPKAMKALRNMGYPISAKKARHESWYILAGTPLQYAEFADRIASEHYSQTISAVRALHIVLANNPNDALIAAAHSGLQMSAIALGQKCGMTMQEVVDEFQPIAV